MTPLIMKIDLRKVPDEWIFRGQKGDYLDVVLYENENGLDDYGNSHSIKANPPKIQREQGAKSIYVGNAKHMPQRNGGALSRPKPQQRPQPRQQPQSKSDEAWERVIQPDDGSEIPW